MKPLHMLMALAVMAIWGVNFAVARVALQDFPPMLLMAIRFAIVATCLVPFTKPPRDKIKPILLYTAVLGCIHFPLMFTGMTGVAASVASVVIQLQVPFASLLAALLFKDKLGWRRAFGMAVAFAGVIFIASNKTGGETDLAHLSLVIAAALAFAVSSIQLKRMGIIDPFQLNGYMALFSVPPLLGLSLLTESGQMEAIRDASLSGWAALAYMVFLGTITAYSLWQPLMRQYDVNQTVPFMMLVPVFGVASGVFWLGEPMSLALILGGALVIVGVGIILIRRPKIVVAGETV